MDKYIGRLLDNRYEILEIIGTGGMAVVYKARCHRLNRLVAIKILKNDYLGDEDFRSRFHAESQAVAMLSHPNIVSVYDVSTSIMADYIVMELIEGISLKQYMEKKGVLNWKETLHFALQIAKALEHAHSRGIVHRDIKPHNIMVLKNGSVKVTDFGIARIMSKSNTLTKEALGSVHYISPEQAKGGHVDNRSDIYSLGVVMYEMICGRPPYDGESPVSVAIQHINGGAPMPSTLNPNIPGGLEQIIMRAMAHDPAERYASATEMLADMDEFRKNPTILFDYNTPPLDAVTRIKTPEALAEQYAPKDTPRQPVNRNRQPREAARKRREEEAQNNRIATIAIVSCSIVAVLAIAIFLIALFGGGMLHNGNPEGELVPAPNLEGLMFEQLTDYGDWQIKISEEIYDENTPAGVIIHQEPGAQEQVASGSTIYVTVSKGPEPKTVIMRDLTDQTVERATQSLRDLDMDLQIVEREEYDDNVQKGCVVRTDPAEGAALSDGQKVTIWVSLGKETVTSQVPNVIGLDVGEAIKSIRACGFRTPDLIYVESDKPKGQVVKQSVEKNTEVPVTTMLTLEVSSGPAETTETPVRKIVKFVLPEGIAEEYTLTITLDDKIIAQKTIRPEENLREIELELTGTGKQYYKLSIDDQNSWIEEVDFSKDD